MLVVTVEIWPGGDPESKRTLGQMRIGNDSGLADISDYSALLYQEASERLKVEGFEQAVTVKGHPRSEGPWKLVYEVLSQIFSTRPAPRG